jgi:hypothetical protein
MSGQPMPMRGWSTMNEEQIAAIAAYVWSITHPPRSPSARPPRTHR